MCTWCNKSNQTLHVSRNLTLFIRVGIKKRINHSRIYKQCSESKATEVKMSKTMNKKFIANVQKDKHHVQCIC